MVEGLEVVGMPDGCGGRGPQALLCVMPHPAHQLDAHTGAGPAHQWPNTGLQKPPRYTSSSTHQPRDWLKAEAPLNMPSMVVTPEMSHAPRSWLKASVFWNIPSIVVTPEVSHAPMSWSKAEAP